MLYQNNVPTMNKYSESLLTQAIVPSSCCHLSSIVWRDVEVMLTLTEEDDKYLVVFQMIPRKKNKKMTIFYKGDTRAGTR